MNAAALQIGIVVKGGGNLEPVVRKLAIAQQRLPQMTGTDDDHIMLRIQPKYLSDLFIKILHIVAIALLTEASEIIQILTDLRCCHVHPAA